MKPEEFTLGQELKLPAWWRNGEWVLCRVVDVFLPRESGGRWLDGSITVVPLEGNPHFRDICFDRLKSVPTVTESFEVISDSSRYAAQKRLDLLRQSLGKRIDFHRSMGRTDEEIEREWLWPSMRLERKLSAAIEAYDKNMEVL